MLPFLFYKYFGIQMCFCFREDSFGKVFKWHSTDLNFCLRLTSINRSECSNAGRLPPFFRGRDSNSRRRTLSRAGSRGGRHAAGGRGGAGGGGGGAGGVGGGVCVSAGLRRLRAPPRRCPQPCVPSAGRWSCCRPSSAWCSPRRCGSIATRTWRRIAFPRRRCS